MVGQRVALRLALRKRQYNGLDRKIVRRILSDVDLQDAVVSEAAVMRGTNVEGLGSFETFFAWLLEHADEIIAFITKLIALFDAE